MLQKVEKSRISLYRNFKKIIENCSKFSIKAGNALTSLLEYRPYFVHSSSYREKYDKMKDDVTVQDEERTMVLEKEKDSVRTGFFFNFEVSCSLYR